MENFNTFIGFSFGIILFLCLSTIQAVPANITCPERLEYEEYVKQLCGTNDTCAWISYSTGEPPEENIQIHGVKLSPSCSCGRNQSCNMDIMKENEGVKTCICYCRNRDEDPKIWLKNKIREEIANSRIN